MSDQHIEERSYSVAIYCGTTQLGDIGYTVSVEEYAGRLHATGHSTQSRTLAGQPRSMGEGENREKLVDSVFDDLRASLLAMIRHEEVVKMLEAIDLQARRPPAGLTLVCANGRECAACDQCQQREAIRARKKRPGCSCPLADYLAPELAHLLEAEEYSTVLERVDGSDTIRILSPDALSIDELVDQLSYRHARQLVERRRAEDPVPRSLLNLMIASIPKDVRPDILQAPGPIGLSQEQLVANAHMNSVHLKKMRTLLRKVEALGLEIAAYGEEVDLGSDKIMAQGALEMATATMSHTEEWLARAVPGGIRSAVYGKVDAPLKSAALALAKIGKTQAEIAGVLKVDKKTVARYLAKTKESERSLARGSKNPTEPWRSKRNMSF